MALLWGFTLPSQWEKKLNNGKVQRTRQCKVINSNIIPGKTQLEWATVLHMKFLSIYFRGDNYGVIAFNRSG